MKKDLHSISKFSDRTSYIYIEHAIVDRNNSSLEVLQKDGRIDICVASLSCIILGPGTSVTHSAIKLLSDNNCLVIWSGENGIRFYASGEKGNRNNKNLLKQAILSSDLKTKVKVAINMYSKRFGEEVDNNCTLFQLRGKEGARMRKIYSDNSIRTGVEWNGRSYHIKSWAEESIINKALSCTNVCLYGVVHAAIISSGYSPALGFIHSGNQLSFVYDIADLYKTEITIPMSFDIVSESGLNIEKRTRFSCRDYFKKYKIIDRIIPDIEDILDIEIDNNVVNSDTGLWNPGEDILNKSLINIV